VTALRVVSWNIRAAIGPGPFPDRWWQRIDADRLRAIGVLLASFDADLIALQEVAVVSRNGALVDNPGDLARQLGMPVRYGAVRSFEVIEDYGVTGVGSFGNALLSHLPMDDVATVALPQAPASAFVEPPGTDHPDAGLTYVDAPTSIREPRCLLLATVGGVRIGTTHFSHHGAGERLLQAEATIDAFGDAEPALLVADLNAPIEAPELGPFASWSDGFVEPPGDPGRVTTDDGFRIDQVLARGASASPVRVVREAGPLSDHYPLVTTVT
jgi:endonuclease/exonuclease/phosphatase family metal-dependent hydrolase